jgi:hypothetical protein
LVSAAMLPLLLFSVLPSVIPLSLCGLFTLTVCILRHLKNRQRILESFLIFFQKSLRKRKTADRIARIHGKYLPERKEKQPETWLVIKMTY